MMNINHLRKVVLKEIFDYFSMYFYGSHPGSPGIGSFWIPGPSSVELGKGQLGNAISQILSTSAKQF